MKRPIYRSQQTHYHSLCRSGEPSTSHVHTFRVLRVGGRLLISSFACSASTVVVAFSTTRDDARSGERDNILSFTVVLQKFMHQIKMYRHLLQRQLFAAVRPMAQREAEHHCLASLC
ncbi:uncharacterized protein BT62DRAFT_384769 [Guyanagaster necrorhizus]|uniref:Uncharacterized protein n=1 Tax=Guyanagaster necrorhizus TaxID=856835 RepID=A0A9P7VJW6_9AGAR|nr:uncharacterized protein BT62DRAFT_384769 [Guyanagaster necrorhizus MCA 3950]KAG7442483.1 hypothetical protein BT62DRAFT_384769 [Guyanagaster necrorhizus MCA 3950]